MQIRLIPTALVDCGCQNGGVGAADMANRDSALRQDKDSIGIVLTISLAPELHAFARLAAKQFVLTREAIGVRSGLAVKIEHSLPNGHERLLDWQLAGGLPVSGAGMAGGEWRFRRQAL